MSALSGECNAAISVDFYNAEVSDWEYAVEPFPMTMSVDQMPNELVSCLTLFSQLTIVYADFCLADFRRDNSKSYSTEFNGSVPSRSG